MEFRFYLLRRVGSARTQCVSVHPNLEFLLRPLRRSKQIGFELGCDTFAVENERIVVGCLALVQVHVIVSLHSFLLSPLRWMSVQGLFVFQSAGVVLPQRDALVLQIFFIISFELVPPPKPRGVDPPSPSHHLTSSFAQAKTGGVSTSQRFSFVSTHHLLTLCCATTRLHLFRRNSTPTTVTTTTTTQQQQHTKTFTNMKRDSPPHASSTSNIAITTSSSDRMGPHDWLMALQSHSQRRRQSARSATIPQHQQLSPKPRNNSTQQQNQQVSPTDGSSESRRRRVQQQQQQQLLSSAVNGSRSLGRSAAARLCLVDVNPSGSLGRSAAARLAAADVVNPDRPTHHSAPNLFPPLLYTPQLTHNNHSGMFSSGGSGGARKQDDFLVVPQTISIVNKTLAATPKMSSSQSQSRSLDDNDDYEGMGIMDTTTTEKNDDSGGCLYDGDDDGASEITLEDHDDELDRYYKQQQQLDRGRSHDTSSTSELATSARAGDIHTRHSSLSSSSHHDGDLDDAERLLNKLMDEQDERRRRALQQHQQQLDEPSPVSTATTCLTQEDDDEEEEAASALRFWDLIPQPLQEQCTSASVVSISSSVVLQRRRQGQGDMQAWGITSTPLDKTPQQQMAAAADSVIKKTSSDVDEDPSPLKKQQEQQQQPKLAVQQSSRNNKPASLQRRSATTPGATTPGPHMIANDSDVLRSFIPAIASQIMMRSKSSICLTDYHQYQSENIIVHNNGSSSDNGRIHPLYKQKSTSSSTSQLYSDDGEHQRAPGHQHPHHDRRRSDGSSSHTDSLTRTHRRSSSVLCGNTVYVV
jgi:hypothetical protein